MNHRSGVNSQGYWDRRFSSDWDELNGPFQTEMFARVALRAMPTWLIHDIRSRGLSIADVGCAEGDAVNILTQEFPNSKIVGYDFSSVAIANAQKRYPGLSFVCGDATELDEAADVVFCSNVVEHFRDPRRLIGSLSRVATRHLIVLVPIWELRRHDEHEYTFQTSSFPTILEGGKVATALNVINTSTYPEQFWNGWQALVVYSDPEAIRDSALTLSDTLRSFSLRGMSDSDLRQAAIIDVGVDSLIRDDGSESHVSDSLLGIIEKTDHGNSRQEQIGAAIKENSRQLQEAAIEHIVQHVGDSTKKVSAELMDRLGHIDVLLQGLLPLKEIEVLKSEYEERLRAAEVELEKRSAALEDEVRKAKHESDSYRTQADWMRGKIHVLQNEVNALRFEYQNANDLRHAYQSRVEELEASTSWRVTAPLRRIATLLRGRSATEDLGRPSGLTQGAPTDYSGQLSDILAKHEGKPIIVFPPLVDWDLPLFQRPHHIATRLARHGYLYFYCTPNGYDGINGFVEIEDGLYVTDQFTEVAGLYREKVLHLYSTDNLTRLDWVVHQQSNLARVLYEYIDEIDPTISGAEIPEHVWLKHRALISDPNVLVVASADKLADEVRSLRDDVELVTNGVDVGHFQGWDGAPVPSEIADMVGNGRPIIGYFGALAVWFDYELVKKLAAAKPNYNILLLGWDYDGSLGRAGLDAFDNVKVIGPIPYRELPKYSRHFDVSTIPFLLNPVTESTSPIKLFEYMSMGTPIVTTDMPECRKYRSVLIGKTQDKFVELIDQALEMRGDDKYLELLTREATENDWDSKASAIAKLLE